MVHRLPDKSGLDLSTISTRLRQLRAVRGKSLRVIADLAGMSKSNLSDIERGERPLDSIRQLVALATALDIAPSELMKLPVPAPGNAVIDAATEAVRLVLDSIDQGDVDGLVVPLDVLRAQVTQLQQWRRAARFDQVATELPTVISNLHTTLATGTDRAELLALAVYLHVHVTRLWLVHACAPTDLTRRVVFLAKHLADQHHDPTLYAVTQFGVADLLATSGALPNAERELARLTLPPPSDHNAGFVGITHALHAITAILGNRPGDVQAPIHAASDIATRFGTAERVDSLGFYFGPTDVSIFKMFLTLEANDPDTTIEIAQTVDPTRHPFTTIRCSYWMCYGRALSRVPGRTEAAVTALRTAEGLFPTMFRREPMIRGVLGSLVTKSKRGYVGEQLRGLAYRAGVRV